MQVISLKTKLIFESQECKDKVIKILEAEKTCFNYCSEVHFKTLNRKNSIVELHNKCYKKLRNLYPTFKSQIIIVAEHNCLSAFKSIKSNKHKIDKVPIKKKLSATFDKRLYSYKDKIFRLSTLEKRVSCKPYIYPRLEEFFSKYKFGDITISVKNNEIYISIPFKVETKESSSGLVLGVDLGIRRFAATSEGKIFIDKKHNKRKRKLRYLKRSLQSKGTKPAKRKLKKLRYKEKNINNNFNHHLTNAILKTNAKTIALEDLKVSQLKSKRNRYQNKNRISQTSLSEIKRILTYKAALASKQVVCVSPYYTSQIDHVTGKLEGNRKGCRFYSVSGNIYDSDINAAINIARRTNRPISQGNPLDGQATVNSPIVGSPCTYNLQDLSGRS